MNCAKTGLGIALQKDRCKEIQDCFAMNIVCKTALLAPNALLGVWCKASHGDLQNLMESFGTFLGNLKPKSREKLRFSTEVPASPVVLYWTES